MIVRIADNIVSPLGFSSLENYLAVKSGQSNLSYYDGKFGLPEPFYASLFDRNKVLAEFSKICNNCEAYTFFEQICILSAYKALVNSGVDAKSNRVIFILSTTKGNVSLLDEGFDKFAEERVLLAKAALQVAKFFKNENKPLVVSNACISGVCAQITALRCLNECRYDYAVVIGADCQSKFIVSGFQSFKALSPEQCKPFDASRKGLNLGEAAATVIYGRKNESEISAGDWVLCKGAIRNDANHISGPSRTGEGSYLALRTILKDFDANNLAFVNTHGTSTLYNDEMESIAIQRAGLIDVPINALKGYYGHTMGAAGILESIISFYAVDDGIVLATRGYENCGVSYPVLVSSENRSTDKKSFVKLLSGFGGCNAAILFKKGCML